MSVCLTAGVLLWGCAPEQPMQARELLAQNDPKGALGRVDTAQADCQTAPAVGEKAAQGKSAASAGKPRRSR